MAFDSADSATVKLASRSFGRLPKLPVGDCVRCSGPWRYLLFTNHSYWMRVPYVYLTKPKHPYAHKYLHMLFF